MAKYSNNVRVSATPDGICRMTFCELVVDEKGEVKVEDTKIISEIAMLHTNAKALMYVLAQMFPEEGTRQ